MSSLVTDFLINPVLRQARRFSNTFNERFDSNTNQQTPREQSPLRHGGLVSEVVEPTGLSVATATQVAISDSSSWASPLSDGVNSQTGREAFELSHNVPGDISPPSAIYRLTDMNRAVRMSIEEAPYDNRTFGISSTVPTASPTTTASSTNDHTSSPSITSRTSTEDGTQMSALNGTEYQQKGPLPEDDGMGHLRRKILAIQQRNVSPDEKAQMMHQLLTEGYSYSNVSLHAKSTPRPPSPANMVNQERPVTPISLSSFSFWQKSTNDTPPSSSPIISHNTYHLSSSDLQPTYAPAHRGPDGSDSDETDNTESGPSLGCQHYKRNVKLQCFDCNRWYTCRFCHDEVEDHLLNRKETRNMLCMICGCAQRASEACTDCGARSAWYYCGICKLWDNDMNKSIYHCADCGICRVGHGIGKDFVHCKTCGVCVAIANENSHKCIERASDCDCPICGEYMFSSLLSVVYMRCGHGIHRNCHHELMKTMYKCPICSQSVVNMETQFRNLDRAIESQPMPPEFQDTKAIVSCNDCYAKSLVKYHWLGLRCAICDSYNTAQLQIMSGPNIEVPAEINGGDHVQLESAETVALMDSRMRYPSDADLVRSRRHSSHARPGPTESASSLFPAYQVPTRIARSASPVRSLAFANEALAAADPAVESEDEDIEFWGGDAPRSPILGGHAFDEEEEEEEESDNDSAMSIDDEEEDDEEDRMDLIGHR